MVIGARNCIETVGVLGFSSTDISTENGPNGPKKREIPSKQQFSGEKYLVYDRARLLQALWKATDLLQLMQWVVEYQKLKQMEYGRRPQQVG